MLSPQIIEIEQKLRECSLEDKQWLLGQLNKHIEAIQQENEEAEKDWGIAEQNAYERILEGSSKSIPVEEFLDWVNELQQGKEV